MEQLADSEVVRSDAVHRRDVPAEDVVPPPELLCALDRDDVARLLDHADDRRVSLRIAAEVALFAFGNIEARLADRDLLLRGDDRVGEPVRLFRRGFQ